MDNELTTPQASPVPAATVAPATVVLLPGGGIAVVLEPRRADGRVGIYRDGWSVNISASTLVTVLSAEQVPAELWQHVVLALQRRDTSSRQIIDTALRQIDKERVYHRRYEASLRRALIAFHRSGALPSATDLDELLAWADMDPVTHRISYTVHGRLRTLLSDADAQRVLQQHLTTGLVRTEGTVPTDPPTCQVEITHTGPIE